MVTASVVQWLAVFALSALGFCALGSITLGFTGALFVIGGQCESRVRSPYLR